MTYRIYVDASGIQSRSGWVLAGVLFVPDHGELHRALSSVKERERYYNSGSLRARYRPLHFGSVRSPRDARVAKAAIDAFCDSSAFLRSLAFDWERWNGAHFGDPFAPPAVKRLRGVSRWIELLIQPELSAPRDGVRIRDAEMFFARLSTAHGFDLTQELHERFTPPHHYPGRPGPQRAAGPRYLGRPNIVRFQTAAPWRDANQCLQLLDVLLGALRQAFEPSGSPQKIALRAHLEERLRRHGIQRLDPGFWRQFHPVSERELLPKVSVRCWKPPRGRRAQGIRRRGRDRS